MRYLFTVLVFFGICLISSLAVGQTAGDYRSAQSGNWSDASTWETYNGTSWVAATSTPTSANGVISILNTHTVTVTANVTIDQTSIEAGGQITVNSGVTLNVAAGSGDDLVINAGGILENNNTVQIANNPIPPPPRVGLIRVLGSFIQNPGGSITNASSSTLIFGSGGTYRHARNNGTIPLAAWNANSTVEVTGTIDGAPNGLNQNFGHFIWNCPSQNAFIDLQGSLTTINGNLEILDNAFQGVYLAVAAGYNLTVGGDLIVSGGTSYLGFNSGNASTINITGNLVFENGSFIDHSFSGDITFNIQGNVVYSNSTINIAYGGAAIITYNIDGDLSISSSTISNQAGSDGQINFTGGTDQTVSGVIDFGNFNFSILNNSKVIVDNSSYFGGAVDFTLNAGSSLATSSSSGISTGTNAGPLRVSGMRTFNSGSIIEYNGTATQALGNGFSSNSDLIINNTGGGVNMNADLTIGSSRTLTLTEGTLNIGSNLLTLNGDVVTTNGGISGGPLSDLTIGGTGAFGTLGFAGTNELQTFTINRSSGGSVTLGGDLQVGTLNLTNGDLNLNGSILEVTGDLDQTSGSINSSATSSFIVSGAGTLTNPLSLSGDMQKLVMNRTSATLNTGAASIAADTIQVFAGTLSYSGGAMTINDGGFVERRDAGTFSAALNAANSFNLLYVANNTMTTGPELPTTGTALTNLTKQGTNTLTLSSNATINGNLTLSNGTFDASTFTVDLEGDFISNANSTLSGSTFTFSGNTNQSGTVIPDFGDIVVSGILNVSSDLNIEGDLTNNGTLTAASGIINFVGTTNLLGSNDIQANEITIGSGNSLTANASTRLILAGDLTNNGTFNANGGTVEFSGTSDLLGTVPTFANIELSGTLNGPSTLELTGNFTNNGTFNNNSGLVRFSGAGSKDITGGSNTVFHDLEVTGGSLTNNGVVTLNNSLEFSGTPTVDLDGSGSGSFTLVSNASNDAYIGDATGVTLSGNIVAERFIDRLNAESKGYHVMSFPASGVTVADLQNEINVTGTFTGSSTGTGFDNNASIFAYDEDAGASLTLNERYVAFPNSGNGETFNVGEGYFIYTYANEAPITVDGTGEISVGNFNSGTLTYTGSNDADAGWHLVANPYPATTDWNAWTKNNVAGNTAYVYDPANGSYITYDDAGPGELIAKGQAFFVKVNSGGGSVSATEASKSTSGTVFYRGQNNTERVEIIASWINNDLSPAQQSDNTIIKFEEGSSDAGDPNDNTGQLNTFEGIFTFDAEGERQQVNSLSLQDGACLREFGILLDKFQENRSYTLSFAGVETLVNKDLYLNDLYTDQSYLITNELEITFDINSDPASMGDQRFSFTVNSAKPVPTEITDQLICASESANVVLGSSVLGYNYIVQSGDSVLQSFMGTGGELTFTIDNEYVNDSTEFLLQAFKENCDTILIDDFVISESNLVLTEPENLSICLGESASINFASNDQIEKFFLQEGENTIDSSATGSFELNPEITASYQVVALLKSGCISAAVNFMVEVETLENPNITANGNLLETDMQADSYQWYFNDELIQGETGSVMTMNEEGQYSLEVSVGNCSARSDVYSFEIEEVTSTDERLLTDIKAYPNPVIDEYIIEKSDALKEVKVRILTVNGRFIDQFILKKQQNKLNLSKLAPGTYIIQYETDAGSYSKRIVKR